MTHIKKLNELVNSPSDDDNMRKNKTIVNNRLSSINVKNELKTKINELLQIIEKL